MLSRSNLVRGGLVGAIVALAVACGEPLTVFLVEPDSASTGEPTTQADAGHDPLLRADAGADAAGGADPGDAEADAGSGGSEDAQTEGPAPPEPPPEEPPAAAQPPPIIGAKELLADTWVETLAGSAVSGLVDGQGADARFHNPVNVVVGPSGDAYVADFDNDRIRRVTPDGTVTTLENTPEVFQRPFGMAFDDTGRFFVQTDGDPFGARSYYTATIWELDPDTGEARTIVADIGRTRGLAALTNGNLLLSDNAWHVVRQLNPDTGAIGEVAGSLAGLAGYQDGHGSAVRFFRPYGSARLPNGHVIVADARNHCLREVSTHGDVTTRAGRCGQPGYVDGAGAEALFNFPQDVAVDAAGEIFVSDVDNHCIRLVAPDGSVATLAGDGVAGHLDGKGSTARFYGQEGLAVTADGHTVYVADGDVAQQKPSHFLRVIRREMRTEPAGTP